MFEVKDLSIDIDSRYLVKSLSFSLNRGDKLAIIGEEGNGKSTLLKVILGICNYVNVSGSVKCNSKVGYLEQSLNKKYLDKTVFEFLFKSHDDYYNKINNFYKYLKIMKLDDSIQSQVMNTLSGGEKVKISILKLLLEEVDILFLDEPTNDLDIVTLEWLEEFINTSNKPIIYISHDETLLSNTANMILHLEQIKNKTECRHTILKIDYDTYINDRFRKMEKQTQVSKSEKRILDKKVEKLNQIMQKVEHQQNVISRSDPHGAKVLKKKMHSLKSQEKKIDTTKLTDVPDTEESIYFEFDSVCIPKAKNILSIDLKELKIYNKMLSKNIRLDVIGNEHICIIGKNGIGKTTLIKYIHQQLLKKDNIKIGYMPQNYDEIFNNYDDVLNFIAGGKSKDEITKIRSYLGNMKFTNEEMIGKISDLSNGSKAKLLLIKLVLDKCNVLILDEPTRNVSPLSNPIIRTVLKNFSGVIISVSHDRKYIGEVVDKIYTLTDDGLIPSNIDY